MLKAAVAVASLIVVVTVAAGVGSKLASGKSEIEFLTGPRISPLEIMGNFDFSQPVDEVKELI